MRVQQQQQAKFTIDKMAYVTSYTSIQGDIGAGKSTVLKCIARYITREGMDAMQINDDSPAGDYIMLVDEPVAKWMEQIHRMGYYTPNPVEVTTTTTEPLYSGLQLFNKKPDEYAFSFQIGAFTSRLALIIDTLSQLPGDASTYASRGIRIHIVAERSMRTDRLFFWCQYLLGNANHYEWYTYCAFFALICTHVTKKESAMIYLRTPPETCKARVIERDRLGEEDIKLDYLQLLDKEHDAMIVDFKKESPEEHRVYELDLARSMTTEEIDAAVVDLMTRLRYDLVLL